MLLAVWPVIRVLCSLHSIYSLNAITIYTVEKLTFRFCLFAQLEQQESSKLITKLLCASTRAQKIKILIISILLLAKLGASFF